MSSHSHSTPRRQVRPQPPSGQHQMIQPQPPPQHYYSQSPFDPQPPHLHQTYMTAQPHQQMLAPQPPPQQPRPQPQMPSAGLGEPPSAIAQPEESAEPSVPTPLPQKKSRTNTPWSPAEEQRLKVMRDAGNSWGEIAKTFPNRTEGSVKKHWYKDMHYADFGGDDENALLNAIREYEANKWKVIGQKVGKPAKACEQYAKEHFGSKKD